MDPEGRFRGSETRIAVAGGDTQSIEIALEQAGTHVARMAPSLSTERLAAQLDRLRQIVHAWRESAPSQDELRTVREQVASMLQLAKTTSPTVRFRRIA